MIEFSHVSKLFGIQKAVNDLNLNFQEGSRSEERRVGKEC